MMVFSFHLSCSEWGHSIFTACSLKQKWECVWNSSWALSSITSTMGANGRIFTELSQTGPYRFIPHISFPVFPIFLSEMLSWGLSVWSGAEALWLSVVRLGLKGVPRLDGCCSMSLTFGCFSSRIHKSRRFWSWSAKDPLWVGAVIWLEYLWWGKAEREIGLKKGYWEGTSSVCVNI